MEDEYYKTREIDSLHQGIAKDIAQLEAKVTEGFKGVHKRQDITNGRISKLEGWRWFMMGGLTIMSVIVIPLLVYLFLLKTTPIVSAIDSIM